MFFSFCMFAWEYSVQSSSLVLCFLSAFFPFLMFLFLILLIHSRVAFLYDHASINILRKSTYFDNAKEISHCQFLLCTCILVIMTWTSVPRTYSSTLIIGLFLSLLWLTFHSPQNSAPIWFYHVSQHTGTRIITILVLKASIYRCAWMVLVTFFGVHIV